MIPPTPSPMPPGVSAIDMSSYSIWNSTDAAIQTWNWMGTVGTIMQVIIIIAMVVATLYMVRTFINQFTEKDVDE